MSNLTTIPAASAGAEETVLGLEGGLARMYDTKPWRRNRSPGTVDTSGASYTLQLADEGMTILHTHTAACVVNLPTTASVALPEGCRITVVQYGAGKITITALSGVTLRNAGRSKSRAQYSPIYLEKIDTNEWLMSGDTSST